MAEHGAGGARKTPDVPYMARKGSPFLKIISFVTAIALLVVVWGITPLEWMRSFGLVWFMVLLTMWSFAMIVAWAMATIAMAIGVGWLTERFGRQE